MPSASAPTAAITGITGQDGSYLTELLLDKGYTVHGIVRRSSMFNRSRIEQLRTDPEVYDQRLFLHYADLHDATTLRRLLRKIQPDEIYHLAGQSHVGLSFEIPESTCDDVAKGTLSLLEICRDLDRPVPFYHASSSEIFGQPEEHEMPQNEATPRRPRSPYGCAKAFATNLCQVYREAYGLYVCSGIAYNHESPRRGENFVTRKITSSAARIKAGQQDCLMLGNLSSCRDWGYAPEYADAMWRMLQLDQPADCVLATGRLTAVRDFAWAAFAALDIELAFEGEGGAELARDTETGRVLIRVDPRFYRPSDPDRLVGDATRASKTLGWSAETDAATLAGLMARADWKRLADSETAALPS
jgi:GDPmannose 4,6-dehydratase